MKPIPIVAALAASVLSTEPAHAATIRWFGQACFEIVSSSGTTVVIDPFRPDIGYPAPNVTADLVLITHEHGDHNNADAIHGQPRVLRGLQMDQSAHRSGQVEVRAVRTDHDAAGGSQRGKNTLFVLKLDRLTIAHCGDLGHLLTDAQVKAIGHVDVLLIPVGGYYTVDGPTAVRVAKQLAPRVIIPMHFKTAATPRSPIAGPEPFLDAAKASGWKLVRTNSPHLRLSAAQLPQQTTVYVLDYE